MAEIQDFGKKIGGARKDMWAGRGIELNDLGEMNAMERKTHIKKDNIWIRPDWEQVIKDGTPQAIAYWQNKMRQSLPPAPPADDEKSQENYVEVVRQIRDAVMDVATKEDLEDFYKEYFRPTFVQNPRGYYVSIVPYADGIVTNKVLKAAQTSYRKMELEAREKLFGVPKDEQAYTQAKNRLSIYHLDDKVEFQRSDESNNYNTLIIGDIFSRYYFYLRKDSEFGDPDSWQWGTWFVMDQKSRQPVKINFQSKEDAQEFVETYAKNVQRSADEHKEEPSKQKRKGAFVPPQLKHIQRTGPNYRGIRHANSDMFLNDLKFRGGEFGNWLNENDRQTSLDMAYDALRDLAFLLHVQPEDVSFNNELAIAFGARGRGGSGAGAAHYEPDRKVINLTKMSGAGCLAHEWGHALDHAIGTACGINGLASETINKQSLPQAFRDLLYAMKYKTVIVRPGEVTDEQKKKIQESRENLKNWIESVKPRQLTDTMAKSWEKTEQYILDHVSEFAGAAYMQFRKNDPILTKPEIEILSQIRKDATNHGIPRSAKRQIVMWAAEVNRYEKEANHMEPVERQVYTDFYNGSAAFDDIYSKSTHGYWHSECEMFARAFDCYIADKIRDSGYHSDYLSARADSFVTTIDGKEIAAIPRGQERADLCEKFDKLLEEVRKMDLLHEAKSGTIQEEQAESRQSSTQEPREDVFRHHNESAPDKPVHYEQMSLDDLLFGAESRKVSARQNPVRENGHSR